jgi:hypothetical protein
VEIGEFHTRNPGGNPGGDNPRARVSKLAKTPPQQPQRRRRQEQEQEETKQNNNNNSNNNNTSNNNNNNDKNNNNIEEHTHTPQTAVHRPTQQRSSRSR